MGPSDVGKSAEIIYYGGDTSSAYEKQFGVLLILMVSIALVLRTQFDS